jgi:hypothetical protein
VSVLLGPEFDRILNLATDGLRSKWAAETEVAMASRPQTRNLREKGGSG